MSCNLKHPSESVLTCFNIYCVTTTITCFVFYNVAPVCCSSRYGLAVLSCYAFFVAYALRVNLSVAMVDMLNSTRKSSTNHSGSLCPAHNSSERPKHNHTVSWNMSVEEDFKYNIHHFLQYVVSCDRLVSKKIHMSSLCISHTVKCLSLSS